MCRPFCVRFPFQTHHYPPPTPHSAQLSRASYSSYYSCYYCTVLKYITIRQYNVIIRYVQYTRLARLHNCNVQLSHSIVTRYEKMMCDLPSARKRGTAYNEPYESLNPLPHCQKIRAFEKSLIAISALAILPDLSSNLCPTGNVLIRRCNADLVLASSALDTIFIKFRVVTYSFQKAIIAKPVFSFSQFPARSISPENCENEKTVYA